MSLALVEAAQADRRIPRLRDGPWSAGAGLPDGGVALATAVKRVSAAGQNVLKVSQKPIWA
jgi:hypothetical protein